MNRKMISNQSNQCGIKKYKVKICCTECIYIKTLMENIFVLLKKIEIWEWKYQNFDETYFCSLKKIFSLGVENKQTRIRKHK